MTTIALLAFAAPLTVVGLAVRLRAWATTPVRRPPPVATVKAPPPRWRWLPLLRRRARAPGELELAAWCERVGGAMRSGRSLTAAVADADAGGDGRSPFPDVVHAVRRGRAIGDAFRAVAADPSTPLGLAAPVLATCADLGGPSAGPIEGVADVLVARADERAERRTASAQARLSARVLSIVPFAVAVFLAATEPSVRLALVTPAGMAMVAIGVALNGAGWLWMTAMVRAAS
jgi:Flp pilus assembly protein TadB